MVLNTAIAGLIEKLHKLGMRIPFDRLIFDEVVYLLGRVLLFSLFFYLMMGSVLPIVECLAFQLFFVLIIFHIMFSRRRSTSSIRSIIDYVYLGVGAVGIISAGMDYSKVEERNFKSILINSIQREAASFPARIETARVAMKCDPHSYEGRCGTINNIANSVDAFELQISKDLVGSEARVPRVVCGAHENLADLLWRFSAKLEASDAINDVIGGIAALQIRSNCSEFKRTFTFEEQRRNFDYIDLKHLGFALLASALALRITRVTVEMRGWDKPRP